MLAELHGKISRSGSNLRTTSEDNLTGNVFGVLRYAPFNKLAKPLLLESIGAFSEETSQAVKATLNEVNLDFWGDKIQFWPYDKEGELDVLLEFDNVIIGVEVKYNSPMSDQDSDKPVDDTEADMESSRKQLARESRIVLRRAKGRKAILMLLARKQFAKDIVKETLEKGLGEIEAGVHLCFVGWEDLLEALKAQKDLLDDFSGLIASDLIALLTRKGFEQFQSFDEVEKLGISVSVDGYYEFSGNVSAIQDSSSFCYDNMILKEDYYEFASRN